MCVRAKNEAITLAYGTTGFSALGAHPHPIIKLLTDDRAVAMDGKRLNLDKPRDN
jgi:hypothetical protein